MLGLGLVAGAVLHAPLQAQVRDTIPKRPDTLKVPLPQRADSMLRDSMAIINARDSIKKANAKADSIKAPIARAEMPVDFAIGRRLHWTRDSLFATGALSLADLLERVPGLTTLRAGWLAAPAVGSYLGDTRRVRVFFDGFEYPTLDPRGRGALDLTQVNLWAAEEVTIDQAADEVRVYIRSWRVRNTTPETRTDVSTGDQQTNVYRGFFGKRFGGGAAFQFGAEQFGTTPPSSLGSSSDQTGIIGRVGWAKPRWSVDGFITRISRHRGSVTRDPGEPGDSIPSVNSGRSDAYARVGYADPDTSVLWAQVMAVASKYDYKGIRTRTITNPKTPADSAFNTSSLDSSSFRSQYVVSAGTVRGPLRVSGTARLFGGGGKSIATPSARASFSTAMYAASAFVEGKSVDSVSRADAVAQFTPLNFVSVLGSVGRTVDERTKDSSFTTKYMRGEVGLKVRNLWLIGGLVRRDSAKLLPPAIFDTSLTVRREAAITGTTVAIRGQLWRLIQADVSAIRWNDSTGLYRPRYQTRSELFARTSLLQRVPSGNLGILVSLVHEYRSGVNYPVGTELVAVAGYRTISSLLEIRILSATVSWQFRNFLGERYMQVPGFIAPRQTNYYGVRWSFVD